MTGNGHYDPIPQAEPEEINDDPAPMAITDKWTLLMGVLFAAQIGTAVACNKAAEAEEDEE